MARVYGTSTDYGSMFGYTCNWGHVFDGRASIVSIVTECQENGRWSVEVPDCIRKYCLIYKSLFTTIFYHAEGVLSRSFFNLESSIRTSFPNSHSVQKDSAK